MTIEGLKQEFKRKGWVNPGYHYVVSPDAQKASLRSLLKMLHKKYPTAVIQGHRDFSPDLNKDGKITPNEWMKACPCFDAKTEYANL